MSPASFDKYTLAVRRDPLALAGVALLLLFASACLLVWYHAREVRALEMAAHYHHPSALALSRIEAESARWRVQNSRPAAAITAAVKELGQLHRQHGPDGYGPALARLEAAWRPVSEALAGRSDMAPMETFLAAVAELKARHEADARRLTTRAGAGAAWWKASPGLPLLLLVGLGALAGRRLFRRISRAALRQQAIERALRRTEAGHARAQAIAHMGHWNWDPRTNRSQRSAEVYRILGRTPDTLGDGFEGFLTAIHPDDVEIVRTHMARALAEKAPYRCEFRALWPDGTERRLESHAEVTVDPETGEVSALLGTLYDITDRARAEESLRASEQRFRLIFDNAPFAIGLGDSEGRILHLNPAGERFLGYTAAEVAGRKFAEFAHPDDLPRYRAFLEQVRADGHGRLDRRYIRKDGQVVWGSLSMRILRDAEGNPGYRIGMVEDITARRAMEEALREGEERLRQVTETIQEVFWVGLPGGGAVLYVSAAYEAIWGRSREAVYRDPNAWVEAIHPDDRERVVEGFAEQIERDTETVFRIVRPDGTVRWIRNRSYPVRDAEGKVYRLVGAAADITEQKRAEASLREQEERTRLILDSTAEGIYEVDLEGRCTFVNAACLRLLGYAREEQLLGRNMHAVVQHSKLDGAPNPEHRCEVRDAVRHDHHFHREDGYVLRADGTPLAVDFWAHPVHRNGELVGAVMTFVDATERRRAEEERSRYRDELAHVTRLSTMGEMTSGLAHEINQPLAAITAFAHGSIQRLRQRDGSDDDGVLESLEQIARQAARAGGIVRHLREFVGKGKGRRAPEEINALVISAVRLIEPEARRHEVAVRLDLGTDLPKVWVDRIEVDQVLINLMKNAVEALAESVPHRELALRTRLGQGGVVVVTVVDNGAGLSEGAAEHLFHPFFTTKPNGLGMGLAISRSIVEAHGGELTLATGNGRGTAFGFTIPVGARGHG